MRSSSCEVVLAIDDSVEKRNSSSRNSGALSCMHGREVVIQKGTFSGQDGILKSAHERENDHVPESPPSVLIDEFFKKQKDAGDQISFDVDLEMNESNSKDVKVLLSSVVDIEADDKHGDEGRRRTSCNSNINGDSNYLNLNGDDQVLSCSSFQRRSRILGRSKTKSRLMDNPDLRPLPTERKSGNIKSGMLKGSGMIANEEEDDPLFGEDLPEEYGKAKVNGLILVQWFSLMLIVTALACSVSNPKWKRKTLRGLELWKWEVLGLVVICGRLVSGWVIRIVVFFIERNFMLKKRVLYFVYGVRKAVQNCFWLGLVLIAWHSMFNEKIQMQNQFLQVVNKLMICMVVATLLWLVKTLMVKVLASSFHVSTFFDRIRESLFNQYVIETLSGPPLIEVDLQQAEEDRTMAEVWRLQNAGATLPPDLRAPARLSPAVSGRLVGNSEQKQLGRGWSFKVSGPVSSKTQEEQAISIDHLHRLNHKNISAWNMKRLMNIVRYGTISTLDEQILGESNEDESTKQIRSEIEAKVAARKIFRNVARPGSKFIYLDDLMRFLREDEAFKAITFVEGSSESTKISKASLKNFVVNTFRERRALALTLNDTKTAVKELHKMVNVVVGVTILIICFVILGLATSKILLFMSSQVVVVAFIFGNTCKTAFEAIIFLFVMHPFDVGDRCEIDGVQMIVEEMNILNTIFLRYDSQKIMYPNSTLATRPIGNFYRSPDMSDSVEFTVHISTPTEKIAQLKQRITSFIDNKKEHWYPSPTIVLMNLQDLKTVKFSVWLRHRMNHQDMGERYKRRALLVDEMINCFKELDMEYRLHPLDINVLSMPPSTSTRVPTTWQSP